MAGRRFNGVVSCITDRGGLAYGVQKFRAAAGHPPLGGSGDGLRTGGSVMASALDRTDSILEPAVECMPRQELDAQTANAATRQST